MGRAVRREGAERVEDLVRRSGSGRDSGTRREKDDRDPLPVLRAVGLSARAVRGRRAVVVHEVLLVARPIRPPEHGFREPLERVGTERGRVEGEPKDEEVDLRPARECGTVEPRLALGILGTPPRVDLVDLGGDLRRALRAPVLCIGRIGVHDADRPPGNRRRPVLGRRRAAPWRGDGVAGSEHRCDPEERGGETCRAKHAVRQLVPRGIVRENRGSVPATSRRTLCRWSAITASAASAVKPTTGHEAPKAIDSSGNALAATSEAADA